MGGSTSQYTHGKASHVSVPQVPATPGNKQVFSNRVASVGQTKRSPPYTSYPANHILPAILATVMPSMAANKQAKNSNTVQLSHTIGYTLTTVMLNGHLLHPKLMLSWFLELHPQIAMKTHVICIVQMRKLRLKRWNKLPKLTMNEVVELRDKSAQVQSIWALLECTAPSCYLTWRSGPDDFLCGWGKS